MSVSVFFVSKINVCDPKRNHLPELIVIADSDWRKLQIMLVLHADVHVFGMWQELLQFSGDEKYEQSEKPENYQYPQKSGIWQQTNKKYKKYFRLSSI